MRDRIHYGGVDFTVSREATVQLPDETFFNVFQFNTIAVRVEWDDAEYVVVFPRNYLGEDHTEEQMIASCIWACGAADESDDALVALEEA